MNNPNLVTCPDCGHAVSPQSESCVNCGRFFQRYSVALTVDRSGWAWTIGWGVLASALISFVLGVCVSIVCLMLLGGLGGLTAFVK